MARSPTAKTPLTQDLRPALISASLFDETAETMRGQVDQFDPVNGIEGWAIDLGDPERILTVELLIGDAVVAHTLTERPRQDIADALDRDVRAGFAFAEGIGDIVCDMAEGGTRGPLRVRIVGTPYVLPSLTSPPSLDSLLSGVRGLQTEGYRGFDMLARLSALRSQTGELLRQPMRPLPENAVGFIESLAIDEAGLIWIGGWMKRATSADQIAVIVDRQKISAGLAVTMFERPDLGSDAYGIIGVLYSDWRPTASSDFFLYLSDGKHFLECARPLNIVSKKSFVEHFAHRWASCHTGHSSTLRYLLDHPDGWQPTDGGAGSQVRASLEQVLILPTFGCLVIGWALSPLKTIENFAMRFGSTILRCDPNSLAFWARPDLDALVPGCDLLTQKAGFVAVFRGVVPPRDMQSPVLKVLLADGTATNHSVDMGVVRRLGRATSVDHVLTLYPSLKSESFFREFAAAVRQDARSVAEHISSFAIAPSNRAIVIGIPAERSDAYFVFEEIGRRVRGRRFGPGIVFVADRGTTRPTVISLFEAFRDSTELPCSLFFVDDPSGCSYALPQILQEVGADRFGFCAPGIVPSDVGWAALTAREEGLTLTTIEDPAGHGFGGRLSLDCFAWNLAPLAEWLRVAPSFIGGLGDNAAVLLHETAAHVIPDGAWFLRPSRQSVLARAINDIAMVA